jgi:cytoskeletal protein RodZ
MDTGTAVSTATGILADRSDAMVILILAIALAGLWLWKVHIPSRESERKLREADKEIHSANAKTLAELSTVTAGIHNVTTHSHSTVRALVEVKEIELDCLDAVSEKAGCDLRSKLSEARGVIRAVRAGVTE